MKICACQLNFTIGDLQGNFNKIAAAIAQNSPKSDVLVFSELCLTGYPPNDLLLRKGFVEKQLDYLDRVRQLTLKNDSVVLLGAVTKNETGIGKPLYNTAIAYQKGEEIFRYHKQLLPTYNIFDENRYFEAGRADQNQIVRAFVDNVEIMFGVLICEDAWNSKTVTNNPLYYTDPMKTVGESNVELIVTINASPSHIGKNKERYEMYRTLAERYKKSILYVNSVGTQDSLGFDGYSFFVYVNKDNPSNVRLLQMKGFVEDAAIFDTEYPENYSSPKIIDNGNEALFEHLKMGVHDYIHKNGFKAVVIGSSGGIDSALTIAIAAEALGPENVKAITMPSSFSSKGSVDDSVTLCNNLGVELYNRPIVEDVAVSIENFKKSFGAEPSRLTIENLQARVRGRILMEYSNHFGSLVLSTGNKSEISVGYFTLYGDSNGGLAVIGDTYKTQVFDVARWYNSHKRKEIIPNAIIDKAPSAELSPNQVDTDSLPAYPELDAILHLYIEAELLSDNERAYYLSLCEPLTLKEIKRILRLIDATEYKRKQLPPTLRISRRAFGFGRNLPITQKDNVDYRSIL